MLNEKGAWKISDYGLRNNEIGKQQCSFFAYYRGEALSSLLVENGGLDSIGSNRICM